MSDDPTDLMPLTELAEYQAYLEWRRDNGITPTDTPDQAERVRAQLDGGSQT